METKLKISGNWDELKGKLKQQYAKLTDEDLTFAEGKEDELLTHLEQKLGTTKEELSKTIEKFQSGSNQSEKAQTEKAQPEKVQAESNTSEKVQSEKSQLEKTI
jgi:uncharacterized protein YjbJ (UPF0337 family)